MGKGPVRSAARGSAPALYARWGRSLLLGATAVAASPWAVTAELTTVTVTFEWSLVFVLVATMGYGLRGGWPAGLVAVAVPFWKWSDNGYAVLAAAVGISGWALAHGWVADRRACVAERWTHPLWAQLPIGLVYGVLVFLLYPPLLAANPAPWCRGDCLTEMSAATRVVLVLKSVFMLCVPVIGARTLLLVPRVRALLALPQRPDSEDHGRLFSGVITTGLSLWLALVTLEETFDGGAWELPIFQRAPTSEEYVELVVLLTGACLAASALMVAIEGRKRQARQAEEANAALLLSELELEQATKMQTLGELAGTVAHDFNNLLSPIFAAVDELQSHDAPQTRQAVADLYASSRMARDLSAQLLDIGRPRKKSGQVIDVQEAVSRAASLLRRMLPAAVQLELDLERPPVFAACDSSLLQNALLNLGRNAVQAMPQGGRLTLALRVIEQEPGPQVEILVSDTGRGIQPEDLDRVFSPTFTKRTGDGGTGLGLASVRRFAARSSGDVQVESTPGRGTTFRLLLPLAEPTQSPGAQDAPARPNQEK